MNRYAVDIVLLPPGEIMSKAIDLNRELIRKNVPKIELNIENCIPHISLSMGVLKEIDREEFANELVSIAGKIKPLMLRCSGVYSVEIPGGENVSGIAIENSEELYNLHYEVMELSGRYLTGDATLDECYFPPPVEEITLQFINNYRERPAYGNFSPHITLGVGELTDPGFTDEFTASVLALFQLGNYCTCRRKMAEIELC